MPQAPNRRMTITPNVRQQVRQRANFAYEFCGVNAKTNSLDVRDLLTRGSLPVRTIGKENFGGRNGSADGAEVSAMVRTARQLVRTVRRRYEWLSGWGRGHFYRPNHFLDGKGVILAVATVFWTVKGSF